MNNRYKAPSSRAIKNYYEGLRISTGLKNKEVAERLGLCAVSLSNLTTRLDQMTGENLVKLSKILGVEPGKFLNTITDLRQKSNELDA